VDNLLIFGASVRAAAFSALRAGLRPWCADLFADADLEQLATVRKVPFDLYPRGLIDCLSDAPQAPILYTGALENWPDLLARFDRPLLGNPADALRAVRTPQRWTKALRERGIDCPDIGTSPRRDGAWLSKPIKSGGGLGVAHHHGEAFDARTHFLQERIDGEPCSAIYLGYPGPSHLLGVARQLIGTAWLNAVGFQYAGNIGPLVLDGKALESWRRVGNALASAFGLRGLFGVDAVVRDGIPWPVEINPRYTASVELFERSFGRALLLEHRAAFEGAISPAREPLIARRTWGKAILYARKTFAFPTHGPWRDSLSAVNLDDAEFADIPHAGEIIAQGRPVLTVFASGRNVAECERNMQEKAVALDRRLWG
jgi:predicted ATP-grasp superfamily ATP-dependent carboligase